MKAYGSVLAFTHERNEALLAAFRRFTSEAKYIRLDEIALKIVNSPSPRFWVSAERAAAVVSCIMRGKPVLAGMRPSKREMFVEIHRRVLALKEECPGLCLFDLALIVVNSPAPKFYMEPSSVVERLYKIRKGWYGKVGRRNNH